MLFTVLVGIATAAPVFKRSDNCKVLSTLYLQCSNGPSLAPSIYNPHCDLQADGSSKCCAINADQSVSGNCVSTSAWQSQDFGCKTDPTTLQTICHNQDGGYSMISPICYGYSNGDHKCCSRLANGTATNQCV